MPLVIAPLPLTALPTEPGEEWRLIAWDDAYAVSNRGRVSRLVAENRYHAGRLLTPTHNQGRNQVRLHGVDVGVAQLVAAAFLPPPADLRMRVHHVNLDKWDDRADNLAWRMPGAIMETLYDAGAKTRGAGEAHPSHKLTESDVVAIRAAKGRETAPIVAARHHISLVMVYEIWDGSQWAHLTDPTALTAEAVRARIRPLRQSLGLSQRALAVLLGVHPNMIADWERGHSAPRKYLVIADRLDALAADIARDHPA